MGKEENKCLKTNGHATPAGLSETHKQDKVCVQSLYSGQARSCCLIHLSSIVKTEKLKMHCL